jgi:hypothetical protein
MKHSRYKKYLNLMAASRKKEENGNANKGVSTLIKDFDKKLLYWTELIHSKYDDEKFYMLRHEVNRLHRGFLIQENVMVSASKIFTYKGKKYNCSEFNLVQTFHAFEQTNKLVAFHDFVRNEVNGEIMVLVKIID